jgi:hypothetical protein
LRRSRSALVLAVAAASLAACGSGAGTPAASTAATGVDLKAAGCPDTVIIQTDWNPESEHGGLYQMLGANPSIDAGRKRVSGPLVDSTGASTGVNLEVRSGGPAIGFQTVTSQLYADPAITLGYVQTDEAAQLSAKQPTVGVMAPLEKSPLMIMWDPVTYPAVKTIADLGKAGTKIRYFDGSAYMAYFTGAGVLKTAEVDGSYDGTPANFVAAAGKDAQQGFASAEPYIYQYEVPQWGKPISFQLINDAGYPYYQSVLSARADQIAPLTNCFTKLVPIMQKAQVDYMAKPQTVNTLILDLVKQFDTGWVYSQGVADFSVKQQLDLKLVSNGANAYIGDFDMDRVQKTIDIDTPIFASQGTPVKPGLKATDLVTNQFIDQSIGLPQ